MYAPRATYRIQLGPRCTFRDVAELVDELAALGVSDVYLSPIFRNGPYSDHGYDVVDHNQIDPALGGRADLDALADRLAAAGMGIVLDIVPNHMGVGSSHNAWWNDVLENGPSSPWAGWFDIAWRPGHPGAEMENKVLLPVLGDHYGRVLERGELQLRYADGALHLAYGERTLPLNPRTFTLVLEPTLPALVEELGEAHEHVLELQSILTGLGHLPPRNETRRGKVIERQREKEILKRRLHALVCDAPPVAREVSRSVAQLNGDPADPASFDRLDQLLEAQAYRLSYWRVAAEEINYRRFFDVNELAAIRMEVPAVFAATHKLVDELLAAGKIRGLRVDHPDGLWDPAGYLAALQQSGPRYVVVEKVLARGEALPDWPVDGTTGYDFANRVCGLFIDGDAEAAITETYARFTEHRTRFETLGYEKKKLILQTSLASELAVLAGALRQIAARNRHSRDFTLGTLTDALRELIACFPVYRTYMAPSLAAPIGERDRRVVERAVRLARRRSPTLDASVYDFLLAVYLGGEPLAGDEERLRARELVLRLQQLTGPVMAKGLEDTAFYIYNRLVSLNEVGGEPARFGTSAAEFHQMNEERRRRWPRALLATTTHDTKRSEDVRARIGVLSELPGAWAAALDAAHGAAAGLHGEIDGQPAPDANEEYLLYQTLLGTWPVEGGELPSGAALAEWTERLVAYMRKATKEAKVNTSWTSSHPDWDRAVERFVRGALVEASPVLSSLAPLARRVAEHGRWSSLGQLVLKLASPGVPDIYQGNEVWDLSLVDPDNRRPVPRDRISALGRALDGRRAGTALSRELVASAADGRIKLWVTRVALDCRRRHPDLLGAAGDYQPLEVAGDGARHAVAFARALEGHCVVAVASRLSAVLGGGAPIGALWGDTTLSLPAGRYRERFGGAQHRVVPGPGGSDGRLPLRDVLAELPVALLETIDR